MEIQSSSINVTQLFQRDYQLDQANDIKPSTQIPSGAFFGPSFEISLSEEALKLIEQSNGPDFDVSLGLSEKVSKELDGLFNKLDQLFETVGDKPLNAEQEKQLSALEKKIDGILGPVDSSFDPYAELSEKATKELESLFNQVDKLFDTVGNKPLSAEQEKQLSALEEKIDGILGPIEIDLDPYADLSEKAVKEVDTLFAQIDKLFETAGDKPLSAEQEKLLTALEVKIEGILGTEESPFDLFQGLSEPAAKELDSLFTQLDKLFDTAGDKPLSAEQEKQLIALEDKIDNILDPSEAKSG
ncbi:hypothetical protein [Kiloniella sp.]|uniref:hypothetical protein n=1 Tax=Kiloniella sp. TaxID=1938587 RepID=UPI003B026BE1